MPMDIYDFPHRLNFISQLNIYKNQNPQEIIDEFVQQNNYDEYTKSIFCVMKYCISKE